MFDDDKFFEEDIIELESEFPDEYDDEDDFFFDDLEKIEEDEIDDLLHTVVSDDDSVPVIPLRGVTIYPTMLLHFDVGREKSVMALENAMMTGQIIFLTSQKNADTDLPTSADLYTVGTIARIKQMLRLPGNAIRVLVEGMTRGEIVALTQEVPFFRAKVERLSDDMPESDMPRIEALSNAVLREFSQYVENSEKISKEIIPGIESIDEAGRMCDIIASHMDVKTEEKQEILETLNVADRLEKLGAMIVRQTEIQKIESDISEKVKQKLNENQKEYYLREQIKTIQKELGQDESVEEEVEKWLKELDALKLPKDTHEKVQREIKRMLRIQSNSPDASVLRNYIETILELPWNKSTKDKIDLKRTKKILDEDHYGLEKVKDRIVEYLAVMSLTKNFKGPIICLVGPPGVGKTSIAKSIARSLNRKFVRMSLGGVHDEAEIRGHRRTYVGAIPGRIITSVKDSGVNNPVFLFDEIDKVGADYRGDPAAALLEVLDPEQNKDFKDHFLDIPFDLSKVLFITTANTTDTIPRPLLDRMELIQLSSYTAVEKKEIAKRHLVPKQIKENGLKPEQVAFSDGAIESIINSYTRESGVRNLEREIGNVCRKVARKVVEAGPKVKGKVYKITSGNINSYLGKEKAHYDKIEGENEVGVVTGMAWTQVGGDTLFIETNVMKGTGKLMLTGQLGDVMQESAKAGLSVIRARSEALGIEDDFYKEKDIHIHIPEGAVPKDGPSAGVTMVTSMVSALTGIPVHKDVAMTGEITLRGNVLAVGGIKEKVIAAHRAGARKILLPEENMKDLDEVPSSVKKDIKFMGMKTIDEVLKEALVNEN